MTNFDYYDDPASRSLVSSTFSRRSADPRFETRLSSTWSDVPRRHAQKHGALSPSKHNKSTCLNYIGEIDSENHSIRFTYTRRLLSPIRRPRTRQDGPLYVGPYATSNKLQVSKLVQPREPWDETTLVAELAANWDDYNLFAAIGPSDATLPVV